MKHFTEICGHNILESTARKFKDAYRTALKATRTVSFHPVSVDNVLYKSKRRPMMLGDQRKDVKEYVGH